MPPVAYEGDKEMSLDTIIDTNIDTQAGTSMEAPTVMEVTPYPTPCVASRTKSHDGKEPVIFATQHILMELVDNINADLEKEKKKYEEIDSERKMEVDAEEEESTVLLDPEADSGYSFSYTTVAKNMNNTTIEFRDTMKDLNDTLDMVNAVELNEKQTKQLQK